LARSLGLTAYRALARREEAQTTPPEQPRPEGELVWLHAAEPANLAAVQDLALRLTSTRDGLQTVITVAENGAPLVSEETGAPILARLPNEHPQSVATFLDHWQPDAAIWVWGGLRPNLVLECAARGCPMFLVDAGSAGFEALRDRWLPDLTRALLGRFSHVLTRSDQARSRLLHLGAQPDRVEVASALMAGGQALPCADSDLAELSSALGGRSVWFASQVQPNEIDIVLSAHVQALRLSHRLLLILNPALPEDADSAFELARARGFGVTRWGQACPDDSTQVMIVNDPADRGLFFRVAPVSYLGSSMFSDQGGSDPFEAAALGSAVLYGPRVRRYLASYTRLAAAGAARIVNDAAALGTAVSHLIAPDQAAAMAHAGWDVISQGAALTDRVTDLVQDALDAAAGRD
jgi:3-deoxy-D-manno-octulosonic-acid transferase